MCIHVGCFLVMLLQPSGVRRMYVICLHLQARGNPLPCKQAKDKSTEQYHVRRRATLCQDGYASCSQIWLTIRVGPRFSIARKLFPVTALGKLCIVSVLRFTCQKLRLLIRAACARLRGLQTHLRCQVPSPWTLLASLWDANWTAQALKKATHCMAHCRRLSQISGKGESWRLL